MNEAQRALLTQNVVAATKSVPEALQRRRIEHFKRAAPEYGARVERGLERAEPGDPRQVSVVK